MTKDDFKRTSHKRLGIGGYRCYCCGPRPGLDRKIFRRTSRRILKSQDHRDFRKCA